MEKHITVRLYAYSKTHPLAKINGLFAIFWLQLIY